jgi:type III restriction enzyme
MRFQFDANQSYQLRAVQTVAGLFQGITRETYSMAVRVLNMETQFDSIRSILDPVRLLENIQLVQKRQGLTPDTELKLLTEKADILGKKGQQVSFPNVSIEMETGTGKTYVYLRTALELNRRFGLKKFIIVVPSVAVREGVLKTF